MFKRKQKPKKLNLRQVHELYLLLKHAIPDKEEELLIDEVDSMIDKLNNEVFFKSLGVMYSKVPETKNPVELLVLFVKGLKENSFFEYVHFIKGLRHG